jgi:hypothetical protein
MNQRMSPARIERARRDRGCAVLSAIIVSSLISAASLACAQRPGFVSDGQIVAEATLVASGSRIDLYQHGLRTDARLVAVAEQALSRMEALLGRKLDETVLGPRVRIYVAATTAISHVWRAYDHPRDPQAIVFLNPKVVQPALSGANATYAHELAHLLTWRYRSHTLREGIADYLALELHPGAHVGPNFGGKVAPPEVSSEVEAYLGTTTPPPGAVMSDIGFRRAYYYASYRFVRYLIERAGMRVFLELYDAEDPESRYQPLYGASRSELVAAARGAGR